MSILPLTGILGIALKMHSISLTITDVVYSASDGQDSQISSTTRTISAAVDPTNRKQLEIIFGGSVSDGSIGIFTSERLYFDDQYNSSDIRKQSFLPYSDATYRVTRSADWTLQAGFYVYLAERHVQQGILI